MVRVYLVCAEGTGLYKIGITDGDTNKRLKQLQTSNPLPLYIVDELEFRSANLIEKQLHKIFSAKRLEGEWFEFDEYDVHIIRDLMVFPGLINEDETPAMHRRKIDKHLSGLAEKFREMRDYPDDTRDEEDKQFSVMYYQTMK